MSPRPAPRRSGITLTEILISILIMGVGLISLATLFPLGLIRLREANRLSRAAYLVESAANDLASKNLLSETTFSQTWFGPYYNPFLHDVNAAGIVTLTAFTPNTSYLVNPTSLSSNPITGLPISDPFWIPVVNATGHTGGGLPICYDPLFYSLAGVSPVNHNPALSLNSSYFPGGVLSNEIRFGGGTILPVGANFTGSANGADGLQRITNFVPWVAPSGGNPGTSQWPYTYPIAGLGNMALQDGTINTFVSPEDIVMQNSDAGQAIILTSPNANNAGLAAGVVPEVYNRGTAGAPSLQVDANFRFTWLFTGQQMDTTQGTVFNGDIVVMEGRPFVLEPRLDPSGVSAMVPAGENTYQAIFGYSTTVSLGASTGVGTVGYGAAADRTVLIRWPSGVEDPQIKVGSWIADVTYYRTQATADNFFTLASSLVSAGSTIYPLQRCHWYQVAKRGDAVPSQTAAGAREMTVYTTGTLKSKTLLNSGGTPYQGYTNTVLFMPSVVNVFPRVFYAR